MTIDKRRRLWYIVFSYMSRIFLTAKEVANLLKLNILTIYEYIKNNELKAIRFGRNYRIAKEDLDRFIESNKTY